MSKGINLAENTSNIRTFSNNNKPVVFLSHKSEDKEFVEKIGEYIMNAGIDIYLDKYDFNLQKATRENDYKKITECIQDGVSKCTHLLCIISNKTKKSWWVPYEIGYGKKAEKKIATLCKSDINSIEIPDYLKIESVIEKIEELNSFIKNITVNNNISLNEKYYYFNENNNIIQSVSENKHFLDNYLKR
ncbi:toll/interleukin-1 receptor domain-containing protein (plasmid) [Clostridium perfringens]|uniref:toll/interleukin-1 receptor domain-containing protein n=1 Tax=Clostridium perfringens TaxID=1502 RepID=UPI00233FB368|nr:toll/interleukin-1 receptor domain-containing protein [Clostridium perfringens]MDC4252319.1 toll/interleukin-1 receptor domain-containing protein [Clostridium perfringens]